MVPNRESAEAVPNGNTIFLRQYFRPSRRTILPWSIQYRLSASTGTIKFAIAAPFWLRTPPRAGTISIDSVTAEPAGIKTLPSSLRSANNVHQRDQRLGQHTEDRKIDCRAIFTGLSPG
jgi:hypothetical protein